MKMHHWRKLGLVYSVDNRLPWAVSHAQIPTVDVCQENSLQILFASRNSLNQSHIASLQVDVKNPLKILTIRSTPLLQLGMPGTFDDSGMMPSSIVNWNGLKYLYYIGWNVRNTVPYHNSIGLAVSDDGGKNYSRMFEGPVMDRTAEEPYFCATSCIRVENGIWRNWYLSCTGWSLVDGRMEPSYHLKYAESNDGICWRRDGRVAIDYKDLDEGGIVRASVCKDQNIYRMWYSYRKVSDYRAHSQSSYRIGYAESDDGLSWRRMDDFAGISPSKNGWDSFMQAYPEVVDVHNSKLMFYNGNGFGESGFGCAILESR
jgi:hypothetical protein